MIVGDKTDASVANRRNEVITLLPDSVTVLGEETGLAQCNSEGRGIEHFGYIDGRSQPLFLKEERLAKDLELSGEEAERAGAMLVGRFEDGTPLTLQSGEGAHSPVMNNFTYQSDESGTRCPRYAHIRNRAVSTSSCRRAPSWSRSIPLDRRA